jgi:L-threonylcarbamoyladenylate synthase
VLLRGGVIVYPTETVWGLGCDPFNAAAVAHLLQIKQRPPEKGLILIGADLDQLRPYVVLPAASKLRNIAASWPGPVTWVFEATTLVPPWVRGKHSTVAVRVSSHPVAQALCAEFGKPLVSTSANISGHPPSQNELLVRRWFAGKLSYFVPGTAGPHRRPSEIRDAASGAILRGG